MHLMILALLLFFHFSCTEDPQINELLDIGLMENNREWEADRGKEDLGQEMSDDDMGMAEGGTSHEEMIENDLDRGLEEQRDPNDFDLGGNMMNEEDMDMSNESSLVPSATNDSAEPWVSDSLSIRGDQERHLIFLPSTYICDQK